MAINPAIPASPSLAAAISSQPAFLKVGDHPPEAAPTPAPVPMRAGEQPQMEHLPVEAQEALRELAYGRADGPAQVHLLSDKQVLAAANTQIDKYVEAEKAGVSLAKLTFIKKLAEVAVQVAIVGIAVAVKCGSFGLLAPVTTPVIALTGANLAVSAGDAWCCYKNWQAAKSQAEGGNKQRVIGGDSIIAHAFMKLARAGRNALANKLGENSRFVASEANVDKWATRSSYGFKVGLAAATSWFTVGLTGAASAVGATTAIQAGAHLAKVGFLVTSITGGAINALTVIQRGLRERQFRGNTERGDGLRDLYKTSIPREARGLQQANSIANDTTRLLRVDPKAFTKAIRAGTRENFTGARFRAAMRLEQTFAGDASRIFRARGEVGKVVTNEAKAQAFASVTKGTAEDFGNAFVNAGKFTLTVLAIANEHYGWANDVMKACGRG
jgi:hypothetical protein